MSDVEAAVAAIDRDRLLDLLGWMVGMASPTGVEGPLAEALVEHCNAAGIAASYQAISEARGNCIGRLKGQGGGTDLLVYGHLDTTFTGDREADRPVLGDEVRPDLEPRLTRNGDLVMGLGVANPKGGTACAVAALAAIVQAGVPLAGDVVLGIVSGGIHKRPIDSLARRYEGPRYQGFGIGCEYMLKHGLTVDAAISTKPGYGIVWEEPGECWFMIEVTGRLCYSGLRHVTEHRNPIPDAAALAQAIEAWLPSYAEQFEAGQIRPQGAVGAIEGGWPYKPEFIPGVCRLYVNMHTNAVTSPLAVRRHFEAFLADYRAAHPDVDFTCETLLSQPGGHTDPAAGIVAACRRAWETVEGKPAPEMTRMSGTTDGNILRNWGIPTVRVGLPGLMAPERGWPSMFDAARVDDLGKVTELYVRAICDVCGAG